MSNLKIGLGRMYNCKGVSLEKLKEISMFFRLEEIDTHAYIGPYLRHLVLSFTFSPSSSEDQDPHKNVTRAKSTIFPSTDVFPADLYLEVVATQLIDVDDSIIEALFKNDPVAREEITAIQKNKKKKLINAIDYIAGMMGLKLHCLLVSTFITEQSYVYKQTGYRFGTELSFTVTDNYIISPESP